MDWQGTSSEANKKVEIAIVKVEATVPVTDPTYGGAVAMNPGKWVFGRYICVIYHAISADTMLRWTWRIWCASSAHKWPPRSHATVSRT